MNFATASIIAIADIKDQQVFSEDEDEKVFNKQACDIMIVAGSVVPVLARDFVDHVHNLLDNTLADWDDVLTKENLWLYKGCCIILDEPMREDVQGYSEEN